MNKPHTIFKILKYIHLFPILLLLSGCVNQLNVISTPPASADINKSVVGSESDRLNQWFEDKYSELLRMEPMRLTYIGRKELYDQIDDFSEQAEQELLEWRGKTVKELKANFNYAALDEDAKLSYDLWIYRYEKAMASEKYRRHSYKITQMGGGHSWFPEFLINMHKVDNISDMHAYIKRINGISRAIRQILENARQAAEMGIRPPRFAYEGAISVAKNVVTGAPFDSTSDSSAPLWNDANEKIASLLEEKKITQDQAQVLQQNTKQALLEDFKTAYMKLIDWLTMDMVNSDINARGASALPDGKAYYQVALRKSTDTDLSASEIHQLGLDEVSRIRLEMETIKNQVGFSGPLQEFFVYIKNNKDFLYPNTDEGRQAYLDDSTAFFDYIRNRLPDFFGIMPRSELVVKRVETFRERDGSAQHYSAGTRDGSRPGVYYAHLSDMNSMPKNEMEAIAYHEGIPGHHLQISIARELENVPEFRMYGGSTSFVEGWALYAELLAKEMGAYKDPYSDFGRLMTEMWRAVRLVLDTGIHAFGWSEDKAFNYCKDNTPLSDGQIRAEVRRYFVWPGQATAYKIGMLKILELRKKAKIALGDNFDIRKFHDTVIDGGGTPITIIGKKG